MIAGADDSVCPAWQTEKLASVLEQAGYKLDVVILPDANHYAPVLHDHVDGAWVVVDDAAGERTVQVILDAIAARASPR